MQHVNVTIRIWAETRKALRIIAAMTGRPMVEVLNRIIVDELERLQGGN